MSEEPETNDLDAERERLVEEIHERISQWADTWEGYEGCHVSAFHIVIEVLTTEGLRDLIEMGDAQSSRFTAMGLLHAALNDPRWLDPER